MTTKDILRHGDLARTQAVSLTRIIGTPGPVRDILDGLYPDEFVESVSLLRGRSRWTCIVEYGALSAKDTNSELRVRHSGRVEARWAGRLKQILDDLYTQWLGWRGDVTTEPPKDCPNDAHREWNPYRTPAAFLPDDGLWRCVGCGWLLDSDGTRIHEHYSVTEEGGQTAKKKRAWSYD